MCDHHHRRRGRWSIVTVVPVVSSFVLLLLLLPVLLPVPSMSSSSSSSSRRTTGRTLVAAFSIPLPNNVKYSSRTTPFTPRRRNNNLDRPLHAKNDSDDSDIDDISVTIPVSSSNQDPNVSTNDQNVVVVVNVVDEYEHDTAVMNRLLRPFQWGELIQTLVGRTIFVVVVFGFILQFFGYSYILEYRNDDDVVNDDVVSSSSFSRHTSPPTFRIGTIEERDFLQEIRRDIQQQQ